MSGTKTAQVRAVDPALVRQSEQRRRELAKRRAELAREAQRERERTEAEARRASEQAQRAAKERARREQAERARQASAREEVARAGNDVARGRSALSEVAVQRAALAGQVTALQGRLDQLSAQRGELRRRLREMKAETERTQERAEEIAGRVDEVWEDVRVQLSELDALRRELEQDLASAREALHDLDASDAVEGLARVEQADAEHAELSLERAVLDAQVQAFAANPTLGIVVDQILGAAGDLGYSVTRVFETEEGVEFHIRNAQQETLRIAAETSAREFEKLTADPDLQLVLRGLGHPTVGACIADTHELLERLRERGVAVTLVTGGEPRPRLLAGQGSREGREERQR